jgi:hypothetical protein
VLTTPVWAAVDCARSGLWLGGRLRLGAGRRLAFTTDLDSRFDALFEEARTHHAVIEDRG